MRDISGARCRENKNTHFMCNNFLEKMYCLRDNVEKIVQPGSHRRQYGAWALHAGYLRTHKHIQNM